MTEYLAIFEYDADGWSAHVPDLPGCVATGSTRAEVEENIRSAVTLHIEALRADRIPIPAPSTVAGVVAA